MVWNIAGIVLNIISIVASIFCWRFAYSSVNKYNRYVDLLYKIDFSKEGAFQKFREIMGKIHNLEKKNQKRKVEFSNQKCEDDKIAKEDLIAALFNAYNNVFKEYDKIQK